MCGELEEKCWHELEVKDEDIAKEFLQNGYEILLLETSRRVIKNVNSVGKNPVKIP